MQFVRDFVCDVIRDVTLNYTAQIFDFDDDFRDVNDSAHFRRRRSLSVLFAIKSNFKSNFELHVSTILSTL